MRKIISLREVVLSSRTGDGGWELCATAAVTYDTVSSTVQVELDSRVQPVDLPPGLDGFRQPWLPAKEVLKRRVPLEEARGVATEVFRQWMTKVRLSDPAPARRGAD